MVEAVSEPWLPGNRRQPSQWNALFRWLVKLLRWSTLLAVLFLVGWGLAIEARTSYLQSRLLSRWAADMKFVVRPGPTDTIRFPEGGPYDRRLGYAQLPSFIGSLQGRHFVVTRQAQWSLALDRFVDHGGYAIYGEKSRAGLQLLDRDQNPLYQASYPQRVYSDFKSIPPLLVDSLLFIEDHALLDPQDVRRNPAVEWGRFMLAVAGRIASFVDRRFREGGASTLATQIEKFRHSPVSDFRQHRLTCERQPVHTYRFSQGTFAGPRGNGRDAPKNEPARAGGEHSSRSVHFIGVMRGSA